MVFRVGAAAGTVAKTISAYDMGVSDSIYGKSSRYVAQDRVEAMLDQEWNQLLGDLETPRGEESTFFAFADTISARNYHGTNICHGWMGIRFQSEPGGEPNTVVLHVNMYDETNLLQQQAIGVLGVNLVYGVFHYQDSLPNFLKSLLDQLSLDQIDVDYVSVDGPLFKEVDGRDVLLTLLREGVAHTVAFSKDGQPSQPMAFLYKCPVVLERGTFESVSEIHDTLLTDSVEQFSKENYEGSRAPAEIFELSVHASEKQGGLDQSEVIARLENLVKLSRPVFVSSLEHGHQLTDSLRRYTQEPIVYASGMSALIQMFTEERYAELSGGIIEGIGRVVSTGVKVYVYPMDVQDLAVQLEGVGVDRFEWVLPEEGRATLANSQPLGANRHLYAYLFEIGALVPLAGKPSA